MNRDAELYVDGQAYATTTELAKAICHCQIDTTSIDTEAAKSLLETLVIQGSLEIISH